LLSVGLSVVHAGHRITGNEGTPADPLVMGLLIASLVAAVLVGGILLGRRAARSSPHRLRHRRLPVT